MASSGNFASINFLAQSTKSQVVPNESNLTFNGSSLSPSNYEGGVVCNFGMKGGKWYWETYLHGGGTPNSGRDWSVGFAPYSTASKSVDDGTYGMALGNGSSATLSGYGYTQYPSGTMGIRHNNSTSSFGSTHASGDILGHALDLDNGTWIIYKNGSSLGTAATGIDTSLTYYAAVAAQGGTVSSFDITLNFGQDSTFKGAVDAGGNADGNGFGDFKYSVPSGYLACSTANLSISDNIDPAQTDDDFPQKQFNVLTYTGNATTGQSLTGLGFKPDLIWAKMRSSSQNNQLYDSSRMNTRGTPTPFGLRSDTTGAEFDDQSTGNTNPIIASFDTDGFTLGGSGSGPNDNARTYVAWCWRANGGTTASNTDGDITSTVQANTNAGFSIVTYTGDNTDHRGVGYGSANIGHGLDSAPEFIITKRRDGTGGWYTYHASAGIGYLSLESTNAFQSGAVPFGPSAPTTTTFGAYSANNNSGHTYVCYCWHSVEGYSKFGSYTGNGNSDGPFIYTGFRPRFVLTKGTSSSGWNLRDSARSPNNTVNKVLQANTTSAEMTSNYDVQFFSNGFKILATAADSNSDGNVYAYGAWGDVPFKYNNTF